MKNTKKNIYLDFDRVLNGYDDKKREQGKFKLRRGCKNFLKIFSKEYNICIYTTRDINLVKHIVGDTGIEPYITDITDQKNKTCIFLCDEVIKNGKEFINMFNL